MDVTGEANLILDSSKELLKISDNLYSNLSPNEKNRELIEESYKLHDLLKKRYTEIVSSDVI